MSAVYFEWRETFPAAAVWLHIAAIHDHHQREYCALTRHDGVWSISVDVPEDVSTSFLVCALDQDALDMCCSATARPMFQTMREHARQDVVVRGVWVEPAQHVHESGRFHMPAARSRPGWDSWWSPVHGGLEFRPPHATDLLLLFDAHHWHPTALPQALTRLHYQGLLPCLEIVALDTSQDRVTRMGRGKELIQQVREVLASRGLDSSRVVVAGQSLGGLMAVDVASQYPDLVGRVVANSGSFWWPRWGSGLGGSLAKDLELEKDEGSSGRKEAFARQRYFLSAGTGEGGKGSAGETMPAHSQAVAAQLRKLGAQVEVEISATGHEMVAWESALSRGLLSVYADYCPETRPGNLR